MLVSNSLTLPDANYIFTTITTVRSLLLSNLGTFLRFAGVHDITLAPGQAGSTGLGLIE